ncbi:hypothetical protein [Zooshikella sp. RANM57]|uniref:hypothetical protein n=1 Tax=Zooshikella sp. RANM57 TaxID=3425863 RepID=UPI003D6F8EB2
MDCPQIAGLKLDAASLEGIERMKHKHQLMKYGAIAITAGTIYTLFFRNATAKALYDVEEYDWHGFSQTMGALPVITRRALQKDAKLQALDHHHDPKQQRFWNAVADGCNVK